MNTWRQKIFSEKDLKKKKYIRYYNLKYINFRKPWLNKCLKITKLEKNKNKMKNLIKSKYFLLSTYKELD